MILSAGLVIGIAIVVAIIIVILTALYYIQGKALIAANDKYKKLDERFKTLTYQKKSSEVRLGKIGENLAPFTKHWPWDPNDFRFLGSPIDGIQFTEDKIYLVEIKTGKSRLSKLQKKCKQLVEAGQVEFVSFRVGPNKVGIE